MKKLIILVFVLTGATFSFAQTSNQKRPIVNQTKHRSIYIPVPCIRKS